MQTGRGFDPGAAVADLMTPQLASMIFSVLMAVVAAFEFALALGAPWGELAMGGAFPGSLPDAIRVIALAQIAVLAAVTLVILSRAGMVLSAWRRASRPLAWVVVGLLAFGVVLNLATPSPMERLIWAPVSFALFLTALRVALSR